jgi:serine/threonine protein kinase
MPQKYMPFLLFCRGYMALEYLNNGVITFKSDIYSLGVIILEILTGQKERCNVENVRI